MFGCCDLGKLPGKPAEESACPTGCVSFCDIPVGSYYQGCGPRVRARLERGEPVTGYKKVGGPRTVRGVRYSGGAVEMLLKVRGYGPKSAPYYPVKGCPCVRNFGPGELGRRRVVLAAERYAAWKAGRVPVRMRRVA